MPKKGVPAHVAEVDPRGACATERRAMVSTKLCNGHKQVQVVDGDRIVICVPLASPPDPGRLD